MAKKRVQSKRGKARPKAKARPRARARVAAGKGKRNPAAKAKAAPARRAAAPIHPVRALAQRIVDLTLQQADEESLALYADNVVSVEPGMPPMTGIDAIRQKFTMWRGMVSASSWDARNVWVDGNAIIIEWVGKVTLAASGREAELAEIAIHEIDNGKIARERFYYDPRALQP
jgi:ketosteroid isomerase-like protein